MRNSFGTSVRRWLKAQSTLLHWLGLPTKPFGYYIPYSYVGDLKPRDQDYTVQWLLQAWDREPQIFHEWLDKVRKYNPVFAQWTDLRKDKGQKIDVNHPRFEQDWFPGLDGAMAYALIREVQPAKIIEVGSGHSTRFMAQAIKDQGLNTHLHSIDPVPRKSIDSICSEITRTTVDKVPLNILLDLKARDVFFIDASHVHMPGTDVDLLFHEVLPCLPKGTFVHIHDIFLPYEYPNEWQWRNYNEQHALLGLLGGGKKFRVLSAHHYFRRTHPDWLRDLAFSLPTGAKEASMWLEVME